MMIKANDNVVTLGPLPTTDLLRGIVLDSGRDRPLHAQLRNSLENLIVTKFGDKDRFYSETQIIAELGLSQGTVRRALADLVTKGYLERRAARGTLVHKPVTASGLYNMAVFLPEWSSFNLGRQFQLLNIECLKRGIALQLFFTHKESHLGKAFEQLKFNPREGGVVLLSNPSSITNELAAALDDKGYRYVIVDVAISNEEQLSGPASRWFSVITSNQSIIEMGMDYLVKAGHRKIALLVNEPAENENIKERVAAFGRYVAASPIPLETQIFPCSVQTWEDSTSAVVRVMNDMWSSKNRPTAIFTTSDYGAVTVITWLQKQGVQVPKEVSVLGIDGAEMGKMIRPALTSVAQPFEKISQTIFHILEDQFATPRRISLEPYMLLQESVTSPASVI